MALAGRHAWACLAVLQTQGVAMAMISKYDTLRHTLIYHHKAALAGTL